MKINRAVVIKVYETFGESVGEISDIRIE